jgi:hypothetical protein
MRKGMKGSFVMCIGVKGADGVVCIKKSFSSSKSGFENRVFKVPIIYVNGNVVRSLFTQAKKEK